jgi:hypothetical protein
MCCYLTRVVTYHVLLRISCYQTRVVTYHVLLPDTCCYQPSVFYVTCYVTRLVA